MAEINVVPYIDVMLVLLIIFMITAPLLKEGVKVDLPTAAAKPIDADLLKNHQPLILTIDARGRMYINFGQNQDQPTSEETVASRTAALLRRDPQTPVLVKAVQQIKALFDTDHDALMVDHEALSRLKADNDNEAAQIKTLTARLDALEAKTKRQ